MTETLKLDPKKSAVLTLDCQNGIAAFVPGAERVFTPAARVRPTNAFVVGSDSAELHSALAAKADEIRVVKHRVSAFSGNDLEMILRSLGVTQLAFFGIATSGIVLSTLRQAADRDCRRVVVKDCCFDPDEEVHRVLTEKVFPSQAAVVGADEFIERML